MIEYTLIRSARKTLAVEISRTGEVIVRAPRTLSRERIESFLLKKADWIARTVQKQMTAYRVSEPLCEGSIVWLFGVPYPIYCGETPGFLTDRVVVSKDAPIEPQIRALLIAQANKVLKERTVTLAQTFGFSVAGVKITHAQKRFGSCSSKRTICLSFRLAAAPLTLIDAVILHELCHTVHMNHGKAFYDLLLRILPDYRTRHRLLCDVWLPRFFCGE